MALVLLIENDAPIIRLMAWYLIDAGFEVSKVATPAEAGERIQARPATVVVFNTGMPDTERREWVRQWHAQNESTRVLDVWETHAPHKVDIGADASISLPFLADTFVELVRDLHSAADAESRA